MLSSRGLSLNEVRAEPHGILFEPLCAGEFYSSHLQTDDGKVDCCPAAFGEALERCESICRQLEAEPGATLKLISLRDPYMHNTWYANLERMKGGSKDRNRLHVHPDDAADRGLEPGDESRLSSAYGAIEVEIELDAALMRGVVALAHGWGNSRTPGMRVAQRTAGVNPNALLPSGPGSFEPLSSQAFMTGVPVELERIARLQNGVAEGTDDARVS